VGWRRGREREIKRDIERRREKERERERKRDVRARENECVCIVANVDGQRDVCVWEREREMYVSSSLVLMCACLSLYMRVDA